MKRLVAIVLLLCTSISHAGETPQSTIAEYDAALIAEDWKVAASMVHASDLVRIRKEFEKLLDLEEFAAIQHKYFGDSTREELRALDDAGFYARVLAALHGQGNARNSRLIESRVIGAVFDGDTTAYVVSRTRMSLLDVSVEATKLAEARRVGNDWFVATAQDLESIVAVAERWN
jgi:hypothetical protein